MDNTPLNALSLIDFEPCAMAFRFDDDDDPDCDPCEDAFTMLLPPAAR